MRMAHTTIHTARVTISVPADLLEMVEDLVADEGASRSEWIQEAIRQRIRALRRERLEAAAQLLDHDEEVALAEEALAAGNEVWPEY